MNRDAEAFLIKLDTETQPNGYVRVTGETRTAVYIRISSVRRTEFWEAKKNGFNPTLTAEMYSFEYESAGSPDIIEIGAARYRVLRAYQTTLDRVELTCEVIV